MRKKLLYVFISLAVGLAALWLIITKVSVSEVISTFRHVRPGPLLMYLLMSAGVMVMFSLRWLVILRGHGHNVPLKSLILYRIAGYGVSFITPTAKVGGEPVRAALLKRHSIEFREGLSSVITDKVIELSTNMLFFIIGLTIVLISFAAPKNMQVILILVSVIAVLMIGYFYYRMLIGKNFFLKIYRFLRLKKLKFIAKHELKIAEFENVMIEYYRKRRLNFTTAVLLSLLGWLFTFGELKYALMLVGITAVSVQELFVILTFIGLAFLIPIPMALGSLEALQISVFSLIGFSSHAAVAMAFIVRTRDILWTVIGLSFLSYYGLKVSRVFVKSLDRVDEEITTVKLKSGDRVSITRKKRRDAH